VGQIGNVTRQLVGRGGCGARPAGHRGRESVQDNLRGHARRRRGRRSTARRAIAADDDGEAEGFAACRRRRAEAQSRSARSGGRSSSSGWDSCRSRSSSRSASASAARSNSMRDTSRGKGDTGEMSDETGRPGFEREIRRHVFLPTGSAQPSVPRTTTKHQLDAEAAHAIGQSSRSVVVKSDGVHGLKALGA